MRVEVVESLEIFATPASVDLVAGASTEINVRVSRLIGESVTVDIVATTGLSVASSVRLANLNEVAVRVTATESYDGTATVTFTTTAEGYESATVAVEIREAPTTPPDPEIDLGVMPTPLEIVTGESTQLTITVSTTATITITGDPEGIAEASTTSFSLGNTESRTINVLGVDIGDTTLTITARAAGYTDTMVSVAVEVVESLQIFATPASVDLVAGSSTEINVRVSRLIGASVTVEIVATTGLSVVSSVRLANLNEVAVRVTATESYDGPATVTFTTTAEGYESATVAVEIREAPTTPSDPEINLGVMPTPLEIVTGESTQLTITVSTTATITITGDPEGIAEASTTSFSLGNTESRTINVLGVDIGDTTLTITARAAGYTDTTVSVAVEVVESLQIFATPASVDLVAGSSTEINVSVSRLIGESVTVEIVATTGLSVVSSVRLANLNEVGVTVTATESYDGPATVTFTTTAEGYESATVAVEIREAPTTPSDPEINLGVMPTPLEIVTGESTQLTITVSTTATITITGDPEGIAEASTTSFSLGNTESRTINVLGVGIGDTTLTITATAAGYMDTTVSVAVEVVESLQIFATPASVDLVAGSSTEINVRVSRLIGASVTVEIVATTGLSVVSSVRLANLNEVAVRVTATESYDGPATVTFTTTAEGYESATVAVEIRAAPPQPDPEIDLSVMPSPLEIVTGESTPLTITVSTTATITITGDPEGIAEASTTSFSLGNTESRTINVRGVGIGDTTLTITATAAGYMGTTVSVAVEVVESLQIFATPASVDLVAGASTEIDVSVNRLSGESVTVDIAATTGLSVASSVLLTNLNAVAVRVTATESYAGTATVTFMAAAEGYESATVAVEIEAAPTTPPDPEIDLSVMPSPLEIVTGESTPLTITVSTTATITITGDPEGIAEASTTSFSLGNTESRTINVRGVGIGDTTLTITATAAGYMGTTVSVAVEVVESLQIFATPASVDLVAGASTEIDVSVNRLSGESVTVDIAATTGLSVASSVLLTNLNAVAVTVTATENYTGTATVTFMAAAEGYESATVAVEIEAAPTTPSDPEINLGVMPTPLEIVTGESTPLTITVSTTATITITGDPEGIAEASTTSFSLGNTESRTINVLGVDIGDTTLTITARAAGYTDTTVSVAVEVVESLQIFATPASVDLVAGSSTEINVRVSRLIGESVTVDIAATTGLSVASSVLLTNLNEVGVTVTATESYDGTATVTFTTTAEGYESATVAVEIRAAPPTQPDPAIDLSVMPSALEIVTGESTPLTITVSTTATITITGNPEEIAEASTTSFSLGNTESRTINVRGVGIGDTTLTITARAAGHMSTTVSVVVEVVESLRIVAMPASVDLVAGASTEINVSVSRLLGESVTVEIVATTGLRVASSVLLTDLREVAVRVTATESYAGTATVTFTTTAEGYESATVAVEIRAAPTTPPDPEINLGVMPTPLEIVTGESTQLTITVSTTATITITGDPEGIAVASTTSFSLGNTESRTINVLGVDIGDTTLTITARAAGYTDTMVSVAVEVVESLQIFATPASVDLVAGSSTEINVRVSRLLGASVTVEIVATTGLSVASSVLLTDLREVAVRVTATESYDGTATVTFTTTAEGYESATVAVEIRAAPPTPPDPAIDLSVMPSALEIVTGESTPLTITVSTTATITITGNPEEIAETSTTSFSLGNTESRTINVRGVGIGDTTLTITADAVGYVSATTSVSVVVQDPLSIEVMPDMLRLVEDVGSTDISVSLNRIEAGREVTVRVTIDPTAGSELTVSPSSLTFSATKLQTTVTITAIDDRIYRGDREVTVTFAADDYASATVTVTIEEDDPQPQIVLEVEPPALEIVTGESTPISITVSTTAMITITSDPEGIAEAPASFGLNENGSTQIDVFGVGIGATTLTITADAVGYVSATTSVSVVVQDPLSIEVTPDSVSLVEMGDGNSTEISVNLNRIEAGREVTVRVTIDPTAGSELTVSPSSLTFSATKLQTTVTITAIDDRIYRGDREVTVTFEADDYASAMVTVTIEEDDPQPQIVLEVEPPALEIVTGESTPISITVSTTARITITSDPEGIAEAPASFGLNENGSTQIDVFGDRSGATTLTITADAVGYVSATTSVSVVVQDPLSLEVTPDSVSLVEMGDGNSTEISVNLNRIEAGREVTVRVTIDPTAGSELTVSPSSLTFSATKLQTTVTITAIDDRIYRGDREVTVTFEADDYASATVTVTIEEDDPQPQIVLEVEPPALEIVTGESTRLTITVSTTATITITGNPEGIAEASTTSFSLGNTESRTINVHGVGIGDTTLTITADAVGYVSATTSVSVVVQDPLSIEVMPDMLRLVEDVGSTDISVSLNRIEAGREVTVRVTIDPTAGSELTVSPSSLTFSATKLQTTVTITAIDDRIYRGDREVTVTFEADDYASATVTVTIEEDDPQPQIVLEVEPPALEIVTGESTPLTITVSTTATITITGNPEGIAEASTTSFSLGNTESRTINVHGVGIGATTLTITADAVGYVSATTSVSVMVQDPLSIEVTPDSVSLVEMGDGNSTEISVNLNRIEAGREVTVRVTINPTAGSELTVSPSSLTFSATKLQTTVTITAIDDRIYRGDREVTVTFEADDYASATVTVTIEEDDPQPQIVLEVEPPALELLLGRARQ